MLNCHIGYENEPAKSLYIYIYVTRFGKTCIVHTSDFSHLEIHKYHRERHTDLKLSGVINE